MNRTAWLIVVILLGLVASVTFIMLNQPDRYRWYESLNPSGDQPYDIEIFKKLLDRNNYNGNLEVVTKPLGVDDAWVTGDDLYNYYIIRSYYFPDTAELQALVEFVEGGNTLFIGARHISPLLPIAFDHGLDSLQVIYQHLSSENHYDVADSIVDMYDEISWVDRDSIHDWYKAGLMDRIRKENLIDTAFEAQQVDISLTPEHNPSTLFMKRREDTLDYHWRKVVLPDWAHPVANYSNDQPFIMRWRFGDGQIFICSTPMLFANLHLLRKEHFAFCNGLVERLPKYDILLDDADRLNYDAFRPKASLGKSPLSFILSKPALRWAWFTLLGTALLFLLFRAKRLQRIIPIIKPNLNTTLAYAKMLGSLQLKEKNNKAKANEIVIHFMQQLRARKRWHSNEINSDLKDILIKLAPQLEKEIQITMHLGTKCKKDALLTDQELVRLFNYSHKILDNI